MGSPPADSFRQIVEEVRDRTDLAQLVGETVSLSSSGSVLKGRSPWNTDRTPSLVVWPHTRTWRDFSGGRNVGGDCFDFVQKRDGVCFMDALRLLGTRAGVDVPGVEDAAVRAELERISGRRRVEGLLTAAAAYYHGVLPSKVRKSWFHERYGFTDETVDRLLLGWADGHLFEHMTGLLGASEKEALETGLFVRLGGGRTEDFFRDRLVFPYWRNGRVVYFIARATEHTGGEAWEQAKYKKLLTRSDRHPYVSACVQNSTFFNEEAAQGAAELLITEGVTDCISAMQAGVACVSPVTTRFRKKDHDKLATLTAGAKRVIICNDSEESGAGDAGALETAQALHAAGRDVRIAVLPRPEGKDKVDLNELVAAGGREALDHAMQAARSLPEFLIEQIPPDTPKAELEARLAPALALLASCGPVAREGIADLVRQRFGLRAATVKDCLRAAQPQEDPKKPATDNRDALKGEVFEETDHYYILGPTGKRITISSFQIEPTQRILLPDGEVFDAELTTNGGRTLSDIRFSHDTWKSRSNFLRALKSADLQWTGSDDHVQGVLRLVASRKVPCRQGTRNLGYVDTGGGPRWVCPDGLLGPLGLEPPNEDLVYVSPGASLAGRLRYKDVPRSEEVEAARSILPNLLRVNSLEVVLPILGWFFAAPLRPRIMKQLGHFPTLVIWSSPGTGKTSMVTELFWRLLGVVSTEPYSATETEFALLKLLSSTDSIPVFIDEYKPFDMPRHRRNMLHRYMRRLYTGEVEERGRPDLTTVTYRLAAPLCLAGETRPTEPAIVERIVTARPSRLTLTRNPEHTAAFKRARAVDPSALAAGIVRFLLARDTDADLGTAARLLDEIIQGREVPFRVRDNLLVTMLGLLHFNEYARELEVDARVEGEAAAVYAVLEDILEGGGSTVQTGLDTFLEELSNLAVDRAIQHGRHYTYRNGLLAIHFPSCHAAYRQACFRSGYEGEVLDRKALRRQIVEEHSAGGYVVGIDVQVCFNGHRDRRRAVLLDLEAIKKRLQVEDFPRPFVRGRRFRPDD